MFGIGYLWIQKTVLKALADIVNEKRNHVPAKIQDKKSKLSNYQNYQNYRLFQYVS